MRGRDDLGGEGEVGAEVLDALVGEVAVVVLPVEGDADEAAAGEGLHVWCFVRNFIVSLIPRYKCSPIQNAGRC